ncbi:MAG TPA: FISUMP domain-containing protein, partial [Bacteroidales bacterium]
SANPVCAGNSVTYTATPTNGGSSPAYQWKLNGSNVGTNIPNYTYTPNNGDIINCILISNILCPTGNPASSNTVTMTVNPNVPVSINITASANPFCQGSSVTFTANPTNGGGNPSYQWKVNGINVGPNNPVYTYIPVSGDLVSCNLTSNATCVTGNPATSNIITMIQNSLLPAGVSIVASTNPFCPGNSVTFTASPVNGGTNPAYQWKINGVNAGINSSIFTYNPASGDLVSCILTSNLDCVTGNPATSNTIIMSGTLASMVTFTLCNDSITTTNAKPFKLKGGIPLGGIYSGVGVSNGIFHPAIAGPGNHQITYTYTNAALCSASAAVTIVTIVTIVTNCGQTFTDIRDGKTYPTVQIGSQCWLAEDLNYGTEILADLVQRDNCLPEKYHNPASSIQYPASVYQWDEIMNYDEVVSTQGLCPPGWHIPTEADWNTLFANYINNGFAASPLKYSGFSGFDALLSGARHMNKTWDFQGFATFFWSSTGHGINKAWAHGMNEIDASVSLYPAFRVNAFSVRCLKD